jgi:hypothetical protein
MSYIYYNYETHAITMISPAVDSATVDPYIEVDDSVAAEFMSGKLVLHLHRVEPDSDIPNIGKIVPIQKIKGVAEIWTPVTDRVYALPKENVLYPDFVIQQDVTAKTLSISLSDNANQLWTDKNYFNLTDVFVVACRPSDPHMFLWSALIPADKLSTEPHVVAYSGEDSVQLYTRKIFNRYLHELLP